MLDDRIVLLLAEAIGNLELEPLGNNRVVARRREYFLVGFEGTISVRLSLLESILLLE